MELTIAISQGKCGFLIGQIKEIPSVVSQGKTENKLKKNIMDARHLYLDDMRNEFIADKNSFIKEDPLACI